jgi:RNA polymerase-binding transcription factor
MAAGSGVPAAGLLHLPALWYPGKVAKQRSPAQLLAAERAGTLQRLAGLEREFAAIIESSGPAGTDDEHDPEGATIAFERQHLAALASQAREHLARIDAAVRRLAEGCYGICETCGQPIGAERLAARPVATTCITCASHR